MSFCGTVKEVCIALLKLTRCAIRCSTRSSIYVEKSDGQRMLATTIGSAKSTTRKSVFENTQRTGYTLSTRMSNTPCYIERAVDAAIVCGSSGHDH
ncbi:hypothetical protein JG688_00015063 [Phytophthora aleatoria]|uniref:Uncharacterized protein n=1 Tax=Phytophthora aleatoria TaxID=2496075 RepID=A0A8J5MD55_9STRA|nr:hypothetical protein JG688_00015063 [Phytophthora aleatoria]